MVESLIFNFKGNSDEIETVLKEILRSLTQQNLSVTEAKKHLIIIRQFVEAERILNERKEADENITIEIFLEKKSVIVEVGKQLSESSYGRLEELETIIQRIRGHQNPLDPLMTSLHGFPSGSKLKSVEYGLAKLAHETGAMLDFYVTENHFLILSATKYLH